MKRKKQLDKVALGGAWHDPNKGSGIEPELL